ncbi:MAG TPA: hypothetical protein VKV74_07985 [Bryobacteraceae bacterium]|nr:hypothetical protein [Bryobacteraceae bacterium]
MRSGRCLLLCVGVLACAQDPFEIQVFEYQPLPRGAYTYEAHINYASLQEQLHFSSELTAGLANQWRAGLVLLTAYVPGQGMEYAGVRILPHFYAPPSWNLPLNLGFVAEFSFERPMFNENTREVELRGIVEKHIGRLQLDGNLVFGRALRGPGAREGWELEPSGRIGWQASPNLTPSLEYYSSLGKFDQFLPVQRQIHLLLPGADWKMHDRLTWSFGVGLGATDASSRIILKSRFEFEFGRNHDATAAGVGKRH